jgi:hypothetical protein
VSSLLALALSGRYRAATTHDGAVLTPRLNEGNQYARDYSYVQRFDRTAPRHGHESIALFTNAVGQSYPFATHHDHNRAGEREPICICARAGICTDDLDASRAEASQGICQVRRSSDGDVFCPAFRDADGRGRQAGVRRRSPEEYRFDPEERGRTEDRSDIVRVAHSVESHGDSAATEQRFDEGGRGGPTSFPRLDTQAFVVGRLRKAVQITVAQFGAGHPVRLGPSPELGDLRSNRVAVGDTEDVARSAAKERETCAQALRELGGLGGSGFRSSH